MGALQPFEGETRVVSVSDVNDTIASVVSMSHGIDETNEALCELDDRLDELSTKHHRYRLLSDMVKRKMRKLSNDL